MEMPEAKIFECKFLLLRYVPDVVKNEFVNIGLMLVPPEGEPELRFDENWSRLLSLYPQANTEMLDGLRQELSAKSNRELILAEMENSFSNMLQAAELKGCLTSSPAEEADKLAKMYLQAAPRHSVREQSARQAILRVMQREFERENVWGRMSTKIDISKYTRAGDPLEIDCGYSFNSTRKMFHATPLAHGVNAAKVLAFSYPELAAGIQKKERANAYLTAIVEDGLEKNDEIGFAQETLERNGIQIATISQMPGLAQIAARELERL